jgi:hypothetical protein
VKEFLRIFKRKSVPKIGFSEFFVSTSREEKERVLREVVREANQDQRDILDRYEKMYPKGA